MLTVKKTDKSDVNILVIDDEKGIRDLLAYELSAQGYTVGTAKDGQEGIEMVRQGNFQLVISDIKMPRMDGICALEEIKKINPEIEVIMATGFGTIETAVASLKRGAYDFIQKPFNVDEILSVIDKALEKAELKALITLYETSKAIFAALKLQQLLPELVRLSAQLLKADDVSIMLLGKDQKLYIAAAQGVDDEIKKSTRLAIGERIAGKVAEWEQSCIISKPLSHDDRFEGIAGRDTIRSSIVAPLLSHQKLLGVLCAARTRQDSVFTASDLRYADIFVAQISQAIENAQLYETLELKIQDLNQAYGRLATMQSELVRAEKLAAVGELASGVAHELNNPLTVVVGLVQLLLEEKDMTPEKKIDLETIREQAERCRKIILNLLQFARKHEIQQVPCDVTEIMEKTLQLVIYDLEGHGVEVRREYAKNIPPIVADVYQIQQVFLNLISNAHDALKGVEHPRIAVAIRQEGAVVRIAVEDNGCGIPEAIIGKIFDPFFTTKEVNCGTGLGLSISYGIIKEHRGTLSVKSQPGKGSVFTVELPLQSV